MTPCPNPACVATREGLARVNIAIERMHADARAGRPVVTQRERRKIRRLWRLVGWLERREEGRRACSMPHSREGEEARALRWLLAEYLGLEDEARRVEAI